MALEFPENSVSTHAWFLYRSAVSTLRQDTTIRQFLLSGPVEALVKHELQHQDLERSQTGIAMVLGAVMLERRRTMGLEARSRAGTEVL